MESELRARCCVAGGGPAGMMLGYLLARAGVDVIVLEKHADFLRDFRGDTIHPSTLEVMNELGLYDQLLQRPHQPTPTLNAQFGSFRALVADFRHLPVRGKFVAMMPQWDFLDFIAKEAQRFSSFRLLMRAEVTKLIEEPNRVTGVVVNTPDGEQKIHSDLVIGCDGRTSTVRAQAGLQVLSLGAPMDVLWFRMSRRPGDPEESMGNFGRGAILVLINRGDYWQCGFVIAKGSIEQARRHGVEFFREEIVKMAPFVKDRVAEITDFDDLRLLTVSVDRLKQWHRPGLLCIGDAAHAMSPIGGVGINLAIQDAVAAANLLISPLRRGQVSDADLQRVQARRELPTRATQAVQVFLQKNVVTAVLGSSQQFKASLPVRLIRRLPLLARIPARLIGMGVRPAHPDLAVIDKPVPT
ncbi:hypothetical protein CKW46_19845 [Mycobacterium liflandii]|nr:hypothetical protein CKW46_19845 [Mycobacterium liflandii]